jgi:two-component sensor histidine kinase
MTLDDLYRLLRAGHVQAQGVFDTLDQAIIVLDDNLCVISANPAFFHTFRVSRDETIGVCFTKLGNGQWDIPALTHLLREVIPRSTALIGYEVTHDFLGLGRRTMLLTARRLVHPDGNSLHMLVVIEDVTSRTEDVARHNLVVAESEHRLKNLLTLVGALARQLPAEGEGAEIYRDAFLSRLEVLMGAELGLFSRSGSDLASVISTLLAPYRERVRLEPGPRVALDRQQVRPISMNWRPMLSNMVLFPMRAASCTSAGPSPRAQHRNWCSTGVKREAPPGRPRAVRASAHVS